MDTQCQRKKSASLFGHWCFLLLENADLLTLRNRNRRNALFNQRDDQRTAVGKIPPFLSLIARTITNISDINEGTKIFDARIAFNEKNIITL